MPFSKEPPKQGDTPKLSEGESKGFRSSLKFFRHPTKLFWGRLCNEKEEKESLPAAPRNVRVAKVKGIADCLQKRIHSSCCEESGGPDCFIWLPAHSGKEKILHILVVWWVVEV
jgi:hypothetical protein